MSHPTRRRSQSAPALRLVKTHDLDRDQWLSARKSGIGSSDAAAAVGLNPYKSTLELWLEKTGQDANLPKVDPNDETSPLYWGNLLETVVAAHYTKRTGHRVRRVNAILQHPTHPWMLANLDREVVGAPDVQILECKTTGLNGARLWEEGVPEYVQLQVMHQLAVTGKQAADVAVLICGQELRVHRIHRDETMIGQLIQLEQQFWSLVERGQQPAADGSDSAHTALRCLYPQDTGRTVDCRQNLPISAAFTELLEVRETLSSKAERENQLKHRIQQHMGDATRAIFRNGEVTWRRAKDSTSIDLEELLRDLPELEPLYARPKVGTRRFLVNAQTDSNAG